MTDVNENDIAVVGLALRVPGAATPEQFWKNLTDGVESRQVYSEEELLQRGVTRSELADPNYVKAGMPLDGMEDFDPEFFGFSPKEAAILDPQHRHFYEVAWEAMERSALPPQHFNGNIGIFAGSGMAAYFARNIMTNPGLVNSVGMFLLRHTGNDKDFLATRVAYAFNLKGPAINVQTACSTSLVAVHIAAQSLLAGECDVALAGGSTIELPHRLGYQYKDGEILSPDGHCRPFDHLSKGTVFGSGCGVVVLRRLADALESGCHIHAVLKGTAINNDGAGKVGYLAPSVDGQAEAITEALAVAGVPVDSVGYVECHGTGTPVGDPIEVAALTNAFREFTEREDFCRIGSVKSNIGHTDTAAGVIGFIKAALALEHGQIPPSLGFEAPNPAIAFEGSPFRVAETLEHWPSQTGPRCAGVNSLGVGGTNAFAVLEEAPEPTEIAADENPQLLVLSARNQQALDETGKNLAKWLKERPEQPLADVAWTLYAGRHSFEQRRVLAAHSLEDAIRLLNEPDPQRVFTHSCEIDRPSLVFMYPGGGAQYLGMGRDLYDHEPGFRAQVDHGFSILKSQSGIDLADIFLSKNADEESVNAELARPSVQLPLIFIIEIALTQLWESYGVTPDAVIGHSLGENTAACVAGVLSFEAALGLVTLRGQLMEEVPPGAMLSVSMSVDELKNELGEELDLAAANSPQLAVASGPDQLITQLAERLSAKGIDSQRIRIDIAAHSRLLDGVLERFRDYLKSISLTEPTLPIISNRTGEWLQPEQATSPDYWVEHLRNSVLFAKGIDTLLESPDRVFLEVGPGHTLGSLARQNPQAPTQRIFAALRHPDDPVSDQLYFRTILGRLWAVGVHTDIPSLWQTQRQRIELPTYPFQHAPYWIEPGEGHMHAEADKTRPVRLQNQDDWFRVPRWIQQGILELSEEQHTWLIFLSDEPASKALVNELRERGDSVVTVRAGDTYTRINSHSYMLAPDAAGAGYLELVESLAEEQLLPDRILHTWLLTWNTQFRPGSTFFHRNQEYGFYSLLHLAQALGKSGNDDAKIHWIVAANGSQQIGSERLPYPDKATALGPCTVISREFTGFSCRFVDIALPDNKESRKSSAPESSQITSVIDALRSETQGSAESGIVAWRDGVRWQRHLGPWKPQASETNPRLREKGVYLITGGQGGIASVLAEWLIRQYQARVVLLGRTPLPTREDWDEWLIDHGPDDSISKAIQRVRQLEDLGGKVLALAGDVTVAERMQEIVTEVREHFGAINGVFHTAGVIRDNLIQLKNQRDIEEVFAAKLYGTGVLDKVLGETPLDFMVLFSSNSAFVAPQGQVDYVAANAFLNAWADSRRQMHDYPVIAVNWGIWKNIGMVSSDSNESIASQPASYPLFTTRLSTRDGITQVHTLRGQLSANEHWIINDHRLNNGAALLPGTGYVELIRAALEECGLHNSWEISNLVFQNPLFVDDVSTSDFEVHLRGNDREWEAEVATLSPDGDNQKVCATARVSLSVHEIPDTLPLDEIQARCNSSHKSTGGSSSIRTRQEDHLRFGPRWRVLKSYDIGSEEALARLRLPEDCTADTDVYKLHPALLDIATGFAMDLIPGYAEQEVTTNLWAPLSYKRLRFHGALPAELVSWARLHPSTRADQGFAVFDVILATPAGEVQVLVEQLTLRRLDQGLALPASADSEITTTAEGAQRVDTGHKPLSPGEEALQHNASQGIEADEGVSALRRLLSTNQPPSTVIVSSISIPNLLDQADAISQTGEQTNEASFSRPELESDFEAPRNTVEAALAELWGKLLGIEGVGIHDSFFDLGGHSLIAVRLFNEISNKYDIDLPMSVLMQSPTIAALAQLIHDETGAASQEIAEQKNTGKSESEEPAFQYVVPMHIGPVADGTPLFMVAGMFGNVLNLSHMAHLLGEERPFYALQARGLYGNAEPHESFEEMATDYLKEVRQVQPKGPYLLGGFSGGGLAAYEMARQLLEAGEQVIQVILLDTPTTEPSPLDLTDRLEMTWQGLRQKGFGYLKQKFSDRLEWEREKRAGTDATDSTENNDSGAFQSDRIGKAFVTAVEHYAMPKVSVDVVLFRPRLDVQFTFRDGRRINSDRRYIAEDNLWTPYVGQLDAIQVPGNHDNMVLEPNVRVLVAAIRKAVNQAKLSAVKPPQSSAKDSQPDD